MVSRIRRFFDVRPGEGLRVLVSFLYVAVVVAAFLLAKPIRNSLFLELYGPYALVYVYAAVPVALSLFVPIYARIAARHPPARRHRLPVVMRIRLLLEVRRGNPQLVLLIAADVDQHGHFLSTRRPEDVGVQDRSIAHRDRDVFLDDHRRAIGQLHFTRRLRKWHR